MANFGPLTAEIGSGVWCQQILTGFASSLLQRRRSPEANQTLLDVWPSHGLVHYIFILGAVAMCKIQLASKSCVLYWQRYCTALQQRASAKLCCMVQGMELLNLRRGRRLYSAGRPSRWASAHIVVIMFNWPSFLKIPN